MATVSTLATGLARNGLHVPDNIDPGAGGNGRRSGVVEDQRNICPDRRDWAGILGVRMLEEDLAFGNIVLHYASAQVSSIAASIVKHPYQPSNLTLVPETSPGTSRRKTNLLAAGALVAPSLILSRSYQGHERYSEVDSWFMSFGCFGEAREPRQTCRGSGGPGRITWRCHGSGLFMARSPGTYPKPRSLYHLCLLIHHPLHHSEVLDTEFRCRLPGP